LSTVNHTTDERISAPMPNIDSAITATNPNTPPAMVNKVLRRPCMAPCVSANSLFGPGESDKPMEASR
jgi:hypothetical protein